MGDRRVSALGDEMDVGRKISKCEYSLARWKFSTPSRIILAHGLFLRRASGYRLLSFACDWRLISLSWRRSSKHLGILANLEHPPNVMQDASSDCSLDHQLTSINLRPQAISAIDLVPNA